MKTDNFKIEFKKLIRDMFESTTSKDWKPWEELDDIKNFHEKFKSEITVSFDEFFNDVTHNFRFYYYLYLVFYNYYFYLLHQNFL